MNLKILFTLGLSMFSTAIFAQKNKDVEMKIKMAISVMDDGEIEKSIAILEEAQKIEPENFDVRYETAYANFLKKDYQKAISILEKLESNKNATYQLYSLWGSMYDYLQKPEKAIEIYEKGMRRFPESAQLYLEKGVVLESLEKYNEAVNSYQKGISINPEYPSNYYRLANLYLKSEDKTPGLVYGEIFVNLERNSDRTLEISKRLFETYKNAVTFENKQVSKIDFCTRTSENVSDPKLPFCMLFGVNFSVALVKTNPTEINLETLSKTRKEALENYFKKDASKYPNILFDYQKKIENAGFFDAYNHYIFQMGDEKGFETWEQNHKDEFKRFADWYSKNKIEISTKNYWNFTN